MLARKSRSIQFLSGSAGDSLVGLFRTHVAARQLRRPISNGSVRERYPIRLYSVLFGSTEPIKLQPMLFNAEKVDFGEWIYVCNSPEDAGGGAVLRSSDFRSLRCDDHRHRAWATMPGLAQPTMLPSSMLPVTESSSSTPISMSSRTCGQVQQVLATGELGTTLWGGLLFYDERS